MIATLPLSPGIDPYSLVPLPLEMRFGAQSLGTATGFIWREANSALTLVTNWHVVSGRDFQTKKHCAHHAGEPDQLVVLVPRLDRGNDPHELSIPLYEENGAPRWLVHPGYGHDVDIAVLPISLPRDVALCPLNALPTMELATRVGMDVFVLGFPFGRGRHGFPVWKRGSVATEPYLSPGIERYLLVDTASRPGMSGSPVIQRAFGWAQLADGARGEISNAESATKLIGIYSGRLKTKTSAEAQLGLVWPVQLVSNITRDGVRDERLL